MEGEERNEEEHELLPNNCSYFYTFIKINSKKKKKINSDVRSESERSWKILDLLLCWFHVKVNEVQHTVTFWFYFQSEAQLLQQSQSRPIQIQREEQEHENIKYYSGFHFKY